MTTSLLARIVRPMAARCAHRHMSGLVANCIMERMPIIKPERPEWVTQWEAVKFQHNFEQRIHLVLKNKKKKAAAAAAAAAAAKKGGKGGAEEEQSAKKKEEKKQKKLQFVERLAPTSGYTENDGVTSLDRKLTQKLYLLVKKDGKWTFPATVRQEDESMRDAVTRAVTQTFGSDDILPFVHFVGYCPMAHLPQGDKTQFYYKAQVVTQPPIEKMGGQEFAWVTREELLGDFLKDETEFVELAEKMLPQF